MTRQEALQLVREFVQSESLVRHMLAVEAAMRFYAGKFGEDAESWGLVGLLHDFDWEIHPNLEQHPSAGAPILRERGVSQDMIQDILSHAEETGVPRDTLRRKALYACDEITGLITAVCLVRPSRSILDLEVSSVKKKSKDKGFAAVRTARSWRKRRLILASNFGSMLATWSWRCGRLRLNLAW